MKQTNTTENDKERALLVSVTHPKHKDSEEERLKELLQLAETAGLEILGTTTQNRDTMDNRWLVGRGKADEIRLQVEQLDIQTVVFNQELSGSQVRNLEAKLDAKIIDRTQLILDIFASRARTKEGKLQVELAQLRYLLPRLAGHYKNLSRLGGGIGTRGPGETQLETDRRHIRRRIQDLQNQVDKVMTQRSIQRTRQEKSGLFRVALVGYTNAGKSTLLERLTDSETYIADQLFATLDPLTRKLELPNGKEIVLTDTVGFIQQLPHELVNAFRATLEEVVLADLIVIVGDSSSPVLAMQLQVVEEVLDELGAGKNERIIVLNKKDLLEQSESLMPEVVPHDLMISAFDEDDLDKLKTRIADLMKTNVHSFRLPMENGELQALLYNVGHIIERVTVEQDDEGWIEFKVELDHATYAKYESKLAPYELGR